MTQMAQGIPDSASTFEQDTIKGAAGIHHSEAPEHTKPLAHVLAFESGPAVDWLQDRFALDLSLVRLLLVGTCLLATHSIHPFISLSGSRLCLLCAPARQLAELTRASAVWCGVVFSVAGVAPWWTLAAAHTPWQGALSGLHHHLRAHGEA